jgi:hypothetical protein
MSAETDCLHTLRVFCPDCSQGMRLIAYNAVRREKYERRCRKCSSIWEITRESVSAKGGVFVDVLEWDQMKRGHSTAVGEVA